MRETLTKTKVYIIITKRTKKYIILTKCIIKYCTTVIKD